MDNLRRIFTKHFKECGMPQIDLKKSNICFKQRVIESKGRKKYSSNMNLIHGLYINAICIAVNNKQHFAEDFLKIKRLIQAYESVFNNVFISNSIG